MQEAVSADQHITILKGLSAIHRATVLDKLQRDQLLQGLDAAEQAKMLQWFTEENKSAD